jgi:hypothetical protein
LLEVAAEEVDIDAVFEVGKGQVNHIQGSLEFSFE